MKLFLDTANLKEIKEISKWGVLDGVTTNPSLVAKEGKVNFEAHVKAICALVEGPVSVEVVSTKADGMVKEGRKIAEWDSNVVVKIPMTAEGLKAVQKLNREGIETNVTLCFSANQALLAAKAGATYVSPFIGRLNDAGHNGMELIAEIVSVFHNYHFSTQVLTASVRSPRDVAEAAMLGADVATVPYKIFEKLVAHPLTDAGVEKFLADWKSSKIKL